MDSNPNCDNGDDLEDKKVLNAESDDHNAGSHSDSTKRKKQIQKENQDKASTSGMSSSSDENDEDEYTDDEKLSTSARSRSPSPTPVRQAPFQQPRLANYVPTVDTLSNAVVNVFCLTCGIIVFGMFLVGSYDYFKNVEENKCEMTWMYHRPYYVPISINADVQESFQKHNMYKLYAYAEGEPARDGMSHSSHQFNGIPVLYIPGNAGSYQQVRSLASVALWKYLDAGTPFHFDFFTVDLNEEFSALYGYSLQRQVDFVRKAVIRIVNLYEEFHKVILIGHSMGGVIAKAVALDPSSDDGSSLSDLILTLASPHANPVIILDPEQDIFYHALKRNWTNHMEKSNNKITLVSVAGGDRDHLVFPKLTRWPNAIHGQTTGVPGVWASTDHLCIVWCKQLVLTMVRSLFDLVEFNQRNKYYTITGNEETKRAVLKYHFVERNSGKSYHGSGRQNTVALSKNIEQIEVTSGVYCRPSGQRPTYLRFPRNAILQNITAKPEDLVGDKMDSYKLLVLTTNTKEKLWIMGCVEKTSTGQCSHGESLARYSKIIPHLRRHRKMAMVPLSPIVSEGYSDLIIKMDSYPFKTCVMLEAFNSDERKLPLGGVLQAREKIFYNLTLDRAGFSAFLASWKVSVTPLNATCPESHNLLAQFNHGTFQQSRFLHNESLLVRHADWNVNESSVQIFLEPSCNYTITTTLALLETAGQFFRVVLRLLPSFYASVVLMSLYFQKDPAEWSSFHVVLLSNAYHLSILPGFCMAVLLHFLPTDWPIMMDTAEFTVLLPILCFLIAYCLVLAVSTGTWYAIITGGTALHSVFVRLLSSRFGSWVPRLFSNHRGFTSVTEHVTEAAFEMTLTRFPLTVSIVLLAISFATCGSLGISLVLVLYVVKLFKIYEDLLEDLLKAKIANVTDCLSPMNFHFCCYMLWLVITVLNVPALLHWSRGIGTEATPQWDLSMYLCLLLLPTVAILWQDFVPKMEPMIWKLHRYIFYIMGMVCVIWGTHRLYLTAFIITFVFLTMAVCQLASVIMSSLNLNAGSSSSGTSTEQNTQPSTAAGSSSSSS